MKNVEPLPFPPARLNPFASHLVERIPFWFFDSGWDEQLARLRQLDFRAAIVGPHGTGKTTLLLELARRLKGSGLPGDSGFEPEPAVYVMLERSTRLTELQLDQMASQSDRKRCWLVDGYERLGWKQRRRLISLTAKSGGLIVTAHRTCSWPRCLPTWVQTRGDEAGLMHVLSHLPLDLTPGLRQSALQLLAQHRGNLRETLRSLYDQAQPSGSVEMPPPEFQNEHTTDNPQSNLGRVA